MTARACTECGAEAEGPADHCDSCGAVLENRRLHHGSDVRIEPERLGEELEEDLELPSGRWGRVSDHPAPAKTESARASARSSERPHGHERQAVPASPPQQVSDVEPATRPKPRDTDAASANAPTVPKSPLPAPDAEAPTEPKLLEDAAPATTPRSPLPNAPAATAPSPLPNAPATTPRAPLPHPANAAPSPELSHWLNDERGAPPGAATQPRAAAAAGTDPRAAVAAASATATGSHATQPRRPPVLASEALLRDLAPPRPSRRALRIWCPLLGSMGASVAWLLTKGQGVGWPLAGAFAGLALLGLPPMPYAGRASAVATVAGTGLALVLWTDAASPDGPATIALTVAVTLLAAGLYFRAWHRASLLARLIVSAGVLIGAAFLWANGDHNDLTLFDTAWQSWLPRVLGLAFGVLLMLSLLAFMDPRSTGGGAVWATFILCWHGMHAAATIMHAAWPKSAAEPDMARIPMDTLLAWASAPLLTALLSLGLAQLLAAGLSSATSRMSDPGASIPPRAPGFRPAEVRARTHAP